MIFKKENSFSTKANNMINVVIIANGIQSSKKLICLLERSTIKTKITSIIYNIEEAKDYFSNSHETELAFLDINFGIQNAIELLKSKLINVPIISVIESENNIPDALKCISIDQIFIPVNEDKVEKALFKYLQLKEYFKLHSNGHNHYDHKINGVKKNYKTRLLVKKGGFFQFIKVEDIACLFTDHKIVFLIDINNNRYITSIKNLSVLEEELDANMFFRANRKYIINIQSIKNFKPLDKVKLVVKLSVHLEEIIISQGMASKFKAWINEESIN